MRLGIDFGTTRTRVAAALKGNYPLITFEAEEGGGTDWYPSLIAVKGDQAVFGPQAAAVQYEADWELLRSFKRLLGDAAPQTTWRIGEVAQPALEWLTHFLVAMRQDLVHRSNLGVGRRERLEAMVGIPANANSGQRFLTLEAFRRAGFEVLGMLSEPSAAAMEYAYRTPASELSRRREHVVVHDLGGGTFDAAVIRLAENRHDVIATEGIARLGGDDFDAVLLELALADLPEPPSASRARLLNLCREAKESISPNSRKVVVDFGLVDPDRGEVLVPVPRFYERCAQLIQRTIDATERAMQAALQGVEDAPSEVAAVYLVGGSCALPVLARALRERFGRRVRRSPYPAAATAIGLVIAADRAGQVILTERFSRHFGVWREGESGQRVVFDPIFGKETALPAPGQPALMARRRYHPVHNVGRLRFLECSALTAQREPAGDLFPWAEVTFPFDPALAEQGGLQAIPIRRQPSVEDYLIEEEYRCDDAGVIQVTIANVTTGYAKAYRLR